MQSKRRKENVADNSDENETDEKPPSTKQMLDTFQILYRGTQHRVYFDYSSNIRKNNYEVGQRRENLINSR